MNITGLLSLIFGLIFIYFMLSMVCNALFEALSSWLDFRSTLLTQWVQKTFPGIYPLLLNNTVLDGLSAKGESTSYMSSANFATSLLGVIARYWQQTPNNLNEVEAALDDFKNHEAARFNSTRSIIPDDFNQALLTFISEARLASTDQAEQMKLFRNKVEVWFDSMMDRITGNYRRKSINWILGIAFVVAVVGDIDSISIVKYLSSNPEATEKLAEAGQKTVDKISAAGLPSTIQEKDLHKVDSILNNTNAQVKVDAQTYDSLLKNTNTQLKKVNEQLSELSEFVPMGWQNESAPKCGWGLVGWILSKFAGLVITILAVSLGAPFWYNLLLKFSDIRNSLKPQAATPADTTKPDAKQSAGR